MSYLMVLLVEFYKVDDNTIACESAFASHLKELLPRVSPWSDHILVHSPSMTEEHYQLNKHHLAHIDCKQENIYYSEAYDNSLSRFKYTLLAPFSIWPKIWKTVKKAHVVHSSVSKDIFKLFGVIALIAAVIQRKKSICVMDIDHRNSAKMSHTIGELSWKSYLLCQYIYNPLIAAQLSFAVRFCNLCMLKGQALTDDFGGGRDNVKNFYDAAINPSFIISDDDLKQRITNYTHEKDNINLVYFGRLTRYKGIQDMIKATCLIKKILHERNIHKKVSLTIIGSGTLKEELQALSKTLNAGSFIHFIDSIPYGEQLFTQLKTYDFLLAAPQSEDTPRSVFDAMACGLPIIAYDTYYYKDLENTGTVQTVKWLSENAMAEKIIDLSKDPETVHGMMIQCQHFAQNNTEEIWLNKRQEWASTFLNEH